jgi:protein-tyrosine phosphatase
LKNFNVEFYFLSYWMNILEEIKNKKREQLNHVETKVTYLHVDDTKYGQDNLLYQTPWFDSLFISSRFGAENKTELLKHNITHVLTVAPNLNQPYPELVKYKTVEILDIPDESIVEKYFEECFEFLDSSLKNGRVLVHCRVGFIS